MGKVEAFNTPIRGIFEQASGLAAKQKNGVGTGVGDGEKTARRGKRNAFIPVCDAGRGEDLQGGLIDLES